MDEVLPGGTVTVLLVEPDEATRNVVAAHLKKCRYRVITAADGWKAWEIVKGKEQLIDLILAETELPLMSGLTLIAMIMENESCKNIPVIMMSTRDSVNTVYSYLQKGASDFLVKPIRRNELSNLWQHVWRRRNMTNGCGRGNKERQKISCSQQNSKYDFANNISGNHSKENGESITRSVEHNHKEGDTQNSSQGSEMEVGVICKNNMINSQNISVDSEFATPEEVESIKFENVLPFHNEARVKSTRLISESAPFNQENGEPTSKESFSAENLDEHNGVTSFDCNDGYGAEGSPDLSNSSVEISLGPRNGKIRKIRQKTGCIIEDGVSNNISMLSNTNNHLELSLGRYGPHHHSNFDMHDCSLQNHSRKSAFSSYCGNNIKPRLLTPQNHQGEKEKASYGSHGNHLDQCGNSTGTLSEATQSSTISSSNEDGKAATCLKEAGNIPFSFLAAKENIFFPQCHISKLQERSLSMNPSIHEALLHANPSNIHGSIYLESERFKDQTDKTEIYHDENKLQNVQPVEDMENLSPSVTGQSSSSSVNGCESHFNGIGCVNNITSSKTTAKNHNDDKLFTHYRNRTAALQRYKLKRSRRAYGKKVRYHNRKRLAEQRPRVKGQFVRQG